MDKRTLVNTYLSNLISTILSQDFDSPIFHRCVHALNAKANPLFVLFDVGQRDFYVFYRQRRRVAGNR